MVEWLSYRNQGATRNQPINDRLLNAMSFLPELGVSMNVYSGGQAASGPNRVGSTRHDHGNAADVEFYRDGRKLDWNNPDDLPVLSDIIARARARGVTGIGAGDDYMGPGRVHIGFGNPAVWGAGGKSEAAPEWLRQAYSSPTSGNAGTRAIASATQPQQPRPGFGVLPDQIAQRMPSNMSGFMAAGASSPQQPPRIPQEERDSVARALGLAPVQNVSQSGSSRAYTDPQSVSGMREDPVARSIRMTNAEAIREATGSGAINQQSINEALRRGATLVRR